MMYNPGKKCQDLTVEIDEDMSKVEDEHAPQLFKAAWNDAVNETFPTAVISGEVVMDEWRWVIAHMVVATRHAFSCSIRLQFNDDPSVTSAGYEPDVTDEGKALYCTGVVLDSLKKRFAKNDRVLRHMKPLFLDRETAVRLKMPTTEIDSRLQSTGRGRARSRPLRTRDAAAPAGPSALRVP